MAGITLTNNVAKAGNGLGGKTHILSVATGTDMKGCLTEAQVEGFTVVAVEGTANGDHFAIQGTGTPSIANATLVVTFDQNPA